MQHKHCSMINTDSILSQFSQVLGHTILSEDLLQLVYICNTIWNDFNESKPSSIVVYQYQFRFFQQGRRFKGPRGKDLAATRIQSSWRMFKDRSEYLEYRRRKWASGVIAISWIMHVKMSKVKVKLKQSREEHLENFRRRARVSFNPSVIQSLIILPKNIPITLSLIRLNH